MHIQSTLSDVSAPEVASQPPGAEEVITPCTSPMQENLQYEKSVENAPMPTEGTKTASKNLSENTKKWYVLRVSYHQEQKAKSVIDLLDDVETFLPTFKSLKRTSNGKRRFIQKCLLPNIIFVRTTDRMAAFIVKDSKAESYVSYYYNHFVEYADGKNPPLIIPQREMNNFIKIATVDDRHIKLATPKDCKIKSDDLVRVTEGVFAGVEGRVARLAGEQRVVVELPGLSTVIATAYIPTAFIEVIHV